MNWTNAAWLSDHTWNVFTNYTGTSTFGTVTAGADSVTNSFGTGNTVNGSFAWIRSGSDLNLQYTAVPEPSSIFAALGLAMCGGWYARRRMKKGSSSGVKAKNDDELNV